MLFGSLGITSQSSESWTIGTMIIDGGIKIVFTDVKLLKKGLFPTIEVVLL